MGNKNKKQHRNNNNNKSQIQEFEANIGKSVNWDEYNKGLVNPSPQKEEKVNVPQSNGKKYVVVRDGIRVSDVEYDAPNDPAAISEKEFWERVAKNHSFGEPVTIVQYDSKKHKVW